VSSSLTPEELSLYRGQSQDGRNIDARVGHLSGEAADQKPLPHDIALESRSFPYIPSRQNQQDPSYYNVPLLKQPVWIWSIPAYFYVGGVAGVGAALGTAIQLVSPDGMRGLLMKARWTATLGGALSAALLIHDLGRPERFLNMLRVFRVSSPMSMGSWILSAFSTFAGGAAVIPLGPRIFHPLASVCGFFAGIFGLGLSGYTGVLISQTAVPVWQQAYRTTPILFLASGTAAAASFFEFFDLNEQETATVERFGLMGKVVELLAIEVLERDASQVKRVGRPLQNGLSGTLWQTAKVLTVVGLILNVLPGKSKTKRIASGLMGSAASLCLRFGIFYAGKASARDPRATFAAQHQTEAPQAALVEGHL
jgi:formate-dependent nitrite reductase membrane component NrfD